MSTIFKWLANLFRRQPPHLATLYEVENTREPEHEHASAGVRVLVSEEDAVGINGLPGLHFKKGHLVLLDQQGGKIKKTFIQQNLLGCGCLASGPKDVAYISDISGLPVCRRCARLCICGHKVTPKERASLDGGATICNVCLEKQMKMEKRRQWMHFLFGAFYEENQHATPPTQTPPFP